MKKNANNVKKLKFLLKSLKFDKIDEKLKILLKVDEKLIILVFTL